MTVKVGNSHILIIVIVSALSYYVQSDVINPERSALHRLPKNVSPISYELWLYPHLKSNNFTYEGRVIINLSVLSSTNSIILNANGLSFIEGRSCLVQGNNSVEILSQELDKTKEFFVISLGVTAVPGSYSLRLDFIGEIRDELFGFYRSAIKVGNEKRFMAVTQFSPTFARAAFPCFDEPYLKATFKLHIGHYKDEQVTSNTLPESTIPTNTDNYVITTMQTTPIMSTYLLGWSIHTFKYDNLYLESPAFVVWTRPSMFGKGHRSLETGERIYRTLEAWMDIRNPIRKMEHIAIPDFYFSAMENWGMITFRESVFLHEQNVTSTSAIHRGMTTMAHEYAHTWFGNLVTPEFWTVAWLKEGFATYFSYHARSLVDIKLRAMDLFIVEVLQSALLDDSGRHLRTMNGEDAKAGTSSLSVMDFVTYNKASSVIRMFASLMGEDDFQRAMRSFLKDRLYNFATPSMLYEHLQHHSKGLVPAIDLGDLIESYANQPGYPLITLVRTYSSNSLTISQERFYRNPAYAHLKNSTWSVPLSLTSESNRSNASLLGALWLTRNNTEIIINPSNIDSTEWIICDSSKAGYYRVNYDERNWDMLAEHLLSNGTWMIGSVARATLLDDAFNLARGGYINYNRPLHLTEYLVKETEYEPWVAATNSLLFLNKIFQDEFVVREAIQDYGRRLLAPIYQSLTLTAPEETSQRAKLLRQLIQSTACAMGNEHCLNTANSIFRRWIANSSERIDPDMKSFVYCVGIRNSGYDDYQIVLNRFLREDLHTELELLIVGLGCSKDSVSINIYLDMMMIDGPQLPKQYRLKILDSVLNGNPENVDYALLYLSQNIERIIDIRGFPYLINVISVIMNRITSPDILRKFISFADNNAHLLEPAADKLRSATSDIAANLLWIRTYSDVIKNIIDSIMHR